MKRGYQKREKKGLSAQGMLKVVRESFRNIAVKTVSKGRPQVIKGIDCLMSAVAMFSLKSSSLLSFDKLSRNDIVKLNLKTLYGIAQAPCDTRMREVLDEIDPRELRSVFPALFELTQKGHLLKEYDFFGTYLLAIDGTGMFESNKVHCANCCEKHHKKGSVSYHHNVLAGAIVHPDRHQVIPFCPEPILKQDGSVKNDCEHNATRRFLTDLKREHPRLLLTILSDALHSTAPRVKHLRELGYSFILNVKPGSHSSLFKWIETFGATTMEIVKGKNTYHFRFANRVPLNDTNNAPIVNFLECTAYEFKGKQLVKRTFSWVTDHEINKTTIYALMRAGRCRWKIENETFNTLKNQGYQFEHNFGHGRKNLTTIFAMLMLLAFLIDQVQEAVCGLFQAALDCKGSRRDFWEILRGCVNIVAFSSWEELFLVLANNPQVRVVCNST